MRIKCTIKEFAFLVVECAETPCDTCILRNMCDGTGIENNIVYEDIIPDDHARMDGDQHDSC